MLGAVWLCVLGLALPCWTYPSGNTTTCEEFGRGVSFNMANAIGEWFTVYSSPGIHHNNASETMTITELTSSQLQQYDSSLRGYSKDKLKLQLKIHQSKPLVDLGLVLVALDDAGNVKAWNTHKRIGDTDLPVEHDIYSLKWQSVDEFLVTMSCDTQRVLVLSKSFTPDEDKLQRVVDNLHIEAGGRIYNSL